MARKFDLDAELQLELPLEGCSESFDLDAFLESEVETAPSGRGAAWGLRPTKGDRELVEVYHRTLGEKLMTLSHPYTAEFGLAAANKLGGNAGRHVDHPSWIEWVDQFKREMNRLYWAVECQTCQPRRPGGAVGKPCLRPSEHPLFGDHSHKARVNAMDEWLLDQIPVWPMDMHEWLRQRGKA